MNHIFTTYKEADILGKMYDDDVFIEFSSDKNLLQYLGLKPSNGRWNSYWSDAELEKSLLMIMDEKKWMLAKIKYGI